MLWVLILIGITVLLSRMEDSTSIHDLLEAPGGVVYGLTRYYQQHNNWQGIESYLDGAQSMFTPFTIDRRFIFSVQDSETKTLYTAPESATVETENSSQVPIFVDNQLRGTLFIARTQHITPSRLGPDLRNFILGRVRDILLLMAAVGSVVGILFGVLVSRTLTAPLERLATAAQAIGARKLHYRVAMQGTQEVVAVAQAFNNMAEALEQAESTRRNLLADVAHELRTPLSVLQGSLQALLDGVYPLESAEIARLYSQTHLLSRLVNDLHELSLAEAHQLHLNRQDTDISTLLASIRDAFIPTAEVAGVRLEFTTADNVPHVYVDPIRFTEIMDNLLGNALRHTPAGGTVSLHAEMVADQLYISVKDTGEGISAEHLPHIFDRFYRTNRGRSRATGGAGLGLAIVRAITEMHGGTISAESEGKAGQGTTINLYLPLGTKPTVEPTRETAF
jgi:signal transduction histidine kinase